MIVLRRAESGQAMVLVVGLAVVAFAVTGIAVDGTRAFLMRRTLQNAVDAAALAGAAEIDTDAYYASGGTVVSLDEDAAAERVLATLGRREMNVRPQIEISARAVHVVARVRMPTTFLGVAGIRDIAVAAEATSEPVTGGRF